VYIPGHNIIMITKASVGVPVWTSIGCLDRIERGSDKLIPQLLGPLAMNSTPHASVGGDFITTPIRLKYTMTLLQPFQYNNM
jgi:hypothetical protein